MTIKASAKKYVPDRANKQAALADTKTNRQDTQKLVIKGKKNRKRWMEMQHEQMCHFAHTLYGKR